MKLVESIGLLHISDLHLAAQPNMLWAFGSHDPCTIDVDAKYTKSYFRPSTFDAAKRNALAAWVSDLSPSIHAAILTGDICTTGLGDDLAEGYNFVSREKRPSIHAAAELLGLGLIRDRMIIVPGNHDRYERSLTPPFYRPDGIAFDKIFKDFWAQSASKVIAWEIGQSQNVFCVAADFTLARASDAKGPIGSSLGQGKVYPIILSDLIRKTKALRQAHNNPFVIWALHFYPLDVSDQSLRLLESGALMDAMKELGVALLLCGHIHERKFVECTSGVVFCASTACSMERKSNNAFHLIRIDIFNESGKEFAKFKIIDFNWDRSERIFADDPSATSNEFVVQK